MRCSTDADRRLCALKVFQISLPERYPSYVAKTGKKLQMFIVLLPESVRESKRAAFISFPCGNQATFRCLRYLCRKPEPGNDDIIHRFNVKSSSK